MRARSLTALSAVAFTVISSGTAGQPRGVYHTDPQHLWNRVHDALFVRVGHDGQEYGRDRIEPLLWRGSKHLLGGPSHDRLLAVLEEFNSGGYGVINDPVKRAMLQRDLWLVFSWLESSHDDFFGFGGTAREWRTRQERLRRPLARAIRGVALTREQIAALPDTYVAAAASRAFADRFDATTPDRPYLPPDLFANEGPWVPLGRIGDLIAPAHVLSDNPFTNSAFLIFIKLPGGRHATRAYVQQLAAFSGNLFVPTPSSPEPVYPNYNPAIPQFPEGTEVALVRRALVVTSTGELVASPITETVQVRVYRRIPAATPEVLAQSGLIEHQRSWQAAYEFAMSRARLFAKQSGGLRAVAVDERDFLTGFSTHGTDPFEERPGEDPQVTARRPGRSRATTATSAERMQTNVVALCFNCHNLPGVYSLHTYTQSFSSRPGDRPGLLTVMPVGDVLESGVAWKRARADWRLLSRLMRESTPTPR